MVLETCILGPAYGVDLVNVLSTRHVPFGGYMPVVWVAIPLWAITLVVAKRRC